VSHTKNNLGATVRIQFLCLHIGHFGVGTRDGFCEHGKETFVSITGQGFVEQQSEFRSSWMFLIPSKTRDLLSSRTNFAPHECFWFHQRPGICWTAERISLLMNVLLSGIKLRRKISTEFLTQIIKLRCHTGCIIHQMKQATNVPVIGYKAASYLRKVEWINRVLNLLLLLKCKVELPKTVMCD